MSAFLGYSLKSLALSTIPKLRAKFDDTANEFDSIDDVMKLFEGGFPLPSTPFLDFIHESRPFLLIESFFTKKDGEQFLKFPLPDILKDDKYAWRTDEEFAREMLAGANLVMICQLKWCCLLVCVSSIWIKNIITSVWMLMGRVAASRLGLWMSDLSVMQQMQDQVSETDRCIVGGVQNSLQSMFDLLTYIMGV